MAPRFTPVSTAVTWLRVTTFTPDRLSSRVSVVAVRRSQPESTRSLRISSVTSQPVWLHREANSTAIAPDPMMIALSGNVSCSNACVESISAPRNGSPGSGRGREPVASTTFAASSRSASPTGSGTSALAYRSTAPQPGEGATTT